MKPEIVRANLFSLQVCVPVDWNDNQVISFAESASPSGTSAGWQIRKTGSEFLNGDPEHNPCLERSEHVHIVLDC